MLSDKSCEVTGPKNEKNSNHNTPGERNVTYWSSWGAWWTCSAVYSTGSLEENDSCWKSLEKWLQTVVFVLSLRVGHENLIFLVKIWSECEKGEGLERADKRKQRRYVKQIIYKVNGVR